tara:strand:- start:144 stop:1100 length:957 start_codon:yes stop_codon:yes gene_type:complete
MYLNRLQPNQNKTSSFLELPFFSEIQSFENFTGFFIPVLSDDLQTTELVTIDEDNVNEYCLHETERVNSILVENLSNKSLLILNGEIFDGAKQDRVSNETILVSSKSSLEIKVSCVERGRWAYKSSHFSKSKNMFNYHSKGVKDLYCNSAKHNHASGSIQDNVWASISNKQMKMGVSSNTGTVNDTYNKFDDFLSSLYSKIMEKDNQVGLLAMVPDKYIGIDLFPNNSIFKKYKERLYKSHLIEMIEDNHGRLRDYKKDINNFMLQLMHAEEIVNKKNLGEEYSIYDKEAQITSNLLVFKNELIHLSAIKNLEIGYAR